MATMKQRRAGRPRKPVHDRLREAVLSDGRPHLQIADAAGIRPSTLWRFMNGRSDVRLQTAVDLAAAVGHRLELVKE